MVLARHARLAWRSWTSSSPQFAEERARAACPGGRLGAARTLARGRRSRRSPSGTSNTRTTLPGCELLAAAAAGAEASGARPRSRWRSWSRSIPTTRGRQPLPAAGRGLSGIGRNRSGAGGVGELAALDADAVDVYLRLDGALRGSRGLGGVWRRTPSGLLAVNPLLRGPTAAWPEAAEALDDPTGPSGRIGRCCRWTRSTRPRLHFRLARLLQREGELERGPTRRC